jgi:hypothetical protein
MEAPTRHCYAAIRMRPLPDHMLKILVRRHVVNAYMITQAGATSQAIKAE